MRFVTFDLNGKPCPGVLSGDTLLDITSLGFSSLIEVIAAGPEARAKIGNLVLEPPDAAKQPLSEAKLLAPIPRPPKVICVGLNYRDHAAETKARLPTVPTIFNKFPTAVIGPGANIAIPRLSKAIDYEAEFAFVIGRGGRHIAPGEWPDHVFGYTIANDVSARDYQRATSQWLMGKTFDTFGPMGPWIATPDEIEDPHELDIRMELNGETMQNSNTRELIFKIPDLIAYLSGVFTLEPGDAILTGTPSGVGFVREPPRFLQPGDECVVKIKGIGELRNQVIAEA